MYSAQLHLKRQECASLAAQRAASDSKLNSRSQLLRARLAEKYNQRVDHFMLAMVNDPIVVHQHKGPLEIAGRPTQPEKFKGTSAMVMKGFRRETRNASVAKQPKIISPPVVQTSVDTKTVAFALNLASTHPLLPQLPAHLSRLSSAVKLRHRLSSPSPTPIKDAHHLPAAFLLDLDRKTHFKGVMSKLIWPSLHNEKAAQGDERKTEKGQRTKTAEVVCKHGQVLTKPSLGEEETLKIAKDVLTTCQVIPAVSETRSFLRAGEGKLISNPFQSTGELYDRLYASPSVSFYL